VSRRRRGDLPRLHLLCDRRGNRPGGATPVFADIDPVHAEPRPRRRRRANHAAHEGDLAGAPVRPAAALEPLAALGVPIVEDAAQAFGARRSRTRASPRPSASSRRRTCSRSATAASSRRPTTELGERVRLLRFHGSRDKSDFELVGYNSRLDELQAARCGSSCRSSTVERGAARGGGAVRRARLGELCELPADEAGHVYHMFVVPPPSATGSPRR
jgi:dTDP-4-amino-4,6-dideoxygalactose transaminase